MKTNQEMVRRMGNLMVIQRTSDAYFNATLLLKEWNKNNPEEQRQLDNFWKSTNLDMLMSEIAENELGFKSVDFTELKNALSKTCRGKKNGGTWMHPVLFIKFAMYLSPRFEYHVLKFVADQMIRYRNDAGDAYRRLSSAISTIVPKNEMKQRMKKVGEALNWIVFRKHEKMLRNQYGEEEKQRELWEFEKKVADLIDEGFITNYDNLLAYLRRTYHKASTPNVFYQLR